MMCGLRGETSIHWGVNVCVCASEWLDVGDANTNIRVNIQVCIIIREKSVQQNDFPLYIG